MLGREVITKATDSQLQILWDALSAEEYRRKHLATHAELALALAVQTEDDLNAITQWVYEEQEGREEKKLAGQAAHIIDQDEAKPEPASPESYRRTMDRLEASAATLFKLCRLNSPTVFMERYVEQIQTRYARLLAAQEREKSK